MAHSENDNQLAARLESELKSIVASREMPLYNMMSYHMGWADAQGQPATVSTGYRTHGMLCLTACRSLGGDSETALPAAAAVELVLNFCQIHDDVQSGSPKREERDSIWWIWGPAQAINAGDGMHALARLALFRLPDFGVPAATTLQAVHLLDEASLRTCEGRFLDLEAQEKPTMSLEEYARMARWKSGALISGAMQLGLLIATHDSENDDDALDAVGKFGTDIGLATQIQADVRDLWADGEAEVGLEAMNKKKLAPVVLAMERASKSEKRRIGDIFFKRVLEPDDVTSLRGIMDDMGVKEECQEMARTYRSQALTALDSAGFSEQGREEITRLVDGHLL